MDSKLTSSKAGILRIIKHPVFIILITVLVALSCLAVWVLFRLHEAKDPQGDANSSCQKTELASISNGSGMLISAHETICADFGSSSSVYVHIHPEGESESSKTLVFRYDENNTVEGLKSEPLNYKWINKNTVRISVGSIYGNPTKQLLQINGIKVIYLIKHIEPPIVVS